MGGNNSLQQYKDGVICSGTNKGWPQINQSTDYTGSTNRQQTVNVGTVLNGQNTPKINWNSPTVPDRILYSNGLWSSSSSSSSSQSGNGLAVLGMVLGGLGALGGIAVPIFSMIGAKKEAGGQNAGFSRSERKEISQNTQNADNAMTALNSCISTAENVDENTSSETLADINTNLMTAITTAEAQKSDALRKAETAKNTLNTKNQDLIKEETKRNGLLNEQTNIESQIDNLEKTDTSNMTDEQKSQLKKQISELKKQLKEIEKKISDSDKIIKQLEADIDVQEKIIEQNTDTANTIEKRLQSARSAASNLNTKINNKEEN